MKAITGKKVNNEVDTVAKNPGTVTPVNPGGGDSTIPTITIQNNTGYTLSVGFIKQSKSVVWGATRLISSLPNGQSRSITLTEPLSQGNVYDFAFTQNSSYTSSGNAFRRWGVTITNGMTITLNDSHYTNGSEQSTIRILNRTGRTITSVVVKVPDFPTGGISTGTISNNGDPLSYTIPVNRSLTTTFNLSLKTETLSFTKNNFNVSSNNMQVLFTSADSETSLAAEKPVIVVQNNTGSQIVYLYVKPAGRTDIAWADVPNLASYCPAGAIQAFTLDTLLSVNDMYDILAVHMFANNGTFIKRNVKITDGMVVTFDNTDKQ
jgi:hypothetical protein